MQIGESVQGFQYVEKRSRHWTFRLIHGEIQKYFLYANFNTLGFLQYSSIVMNLLL